MAKREFRTTQFAENDWRFCIPETQECVLVLSDVYLEVLFAWARDELWKTGRMPCEIVASWNEIRLPWKGRGSARLEFDDVLVTLLRRYSEEGEESDGPDLQPMRTVAAAVANIFEALPGAVVVCRDW